ncbi:MAG: glycosyl hydrolase family 8 [Candidatus Saganbacteria bacterium]|nr:glycosyl hydrolase family 8 [Candidatus Saganbacteria bacterium]
MVTPVNLSVLSIFGQMPPEKIGGERGSVEIDRALADKAIAAIDVALTARVFLVESKLGTTNEPIYFIKNPVRSDEIVSEAMGYWMKILVNASFYLSKVDPDKAKHYQKIFNGLLRGVTLMLNQNGLSKWHCVYDTITGLPQARTDDEKYSATDADVYIAWALLQAQSLTPKQNKPGIWDPPQQELDYKKWTDHFLARIKGIEARKVKNKAGAERYILSPSDSWGEEDFKGSVTVNPSYGVLSAFMDFARYDAEDDPKKNFWFKLIKDTFDIIKGSYEFGKQVLIECKEKDKNGNYVYHQELADGETLRVEAKYVMLIRSLLWKVMPTSPEEVQAFAKMGVVFDKSKEFIDISEKLLNIDGTWNISKKSLEGIMKKLEETYHLDRFFPDQIEVDLMNDEKGSFKIRIEKGAANLGFTEGNDGARLLKELGEYLFLFGALEESEVPEDFRISKDVLALLKEFIPYRDPKTVKADRFHNLVAISCCFMGAVGTASMGEYKEKKDSFEAEMRERPLIPYDPYRKNTAKYFDASLAELALTSIMSKKGPGEFPIERREEPIKPVRREDTEEFKRNHEIKLPETIPLPMGLGKNFEYFLRAVLKDSFLASHFDENLCLVPYICSASPEKKPDYALASKRDFLLYKEHANEKDPQSLCLLGESLLGIGEYHEAANVFFKIVKGMGEPNGEIDQKLLSASIKNLIDILRILNISHAEISDDFEWLLEQGNMPPNKKLFIRLAFIRELNEIGRTTEALRQELKWFKEYEALYGNFNSAEKFVETVRHLPLVGKNTRNPIPRKELLAKATAEFIFTAADNYSIELDKAPIRYTINYKPYKKRAYHYRNAFEIGRDILGSDTPMSIINLLKELKIYKEENPKIKEIMNIINEFKHEIPEDFKPTILFTMGRILNKMGYDLKFEIENKEYLNQDWLFHWSLGNKPDEKTKEFKKMIKYCNLAIENYKTALSKELKLRQEPRFLEEILDRLLGTYQYQIEILKLIEGLETSEVNDEEYHRPQANKDYHDERNKIKDKYKLKIDAVYEEAASIGKTIVGRFKPHPVINKLRFRGNDINLAVREIVASEDSADPRNAIYSRWVMRIIDSYQLMGMKGKDEEKFEQALQMCEILPTIYVSNAEQRALFLLDAILKMEEILYFYKNHLKERLELKTGKEIKMEEIKETQGLTKEDIEIKNKIENINNGFMLIFKALLEGKDPSDAEKAGLSARDRNFIEYIKENRATLDKIFDKTPIYRSGAYAKYGNLLWWGETDLNKIELAKEKYEKALEKDSFNTAALIGFGRTSLKLGTQQDVVKILKIAVKALRSLSGRPNPELLKDLTPLFTDLKAKTSEQSIKDLLDTTISTIKKGEELTQADIEEILYAFRDY